MRRPACGGRTEQHGGNSNRHVVSALARGEHEVLLREAVALWEVSNEYRITR